ncbi:hypothetical protein DPMN_011068 [Dreissena polymorpha]|uniref:Uncharacterized protein n=1 Tax=Dreissena polymorpha TaxID=45954 RepID=A0A9D4S1I1_DREPO|nr:hypothetical protein DPMN_011068 [Dreissena polymorpha]
MLNPVHEGITLIRFRCILDATQQLSLQVNKLFRTTCQVCQDCIITGPVLNSGSS